MPAQRLMIAFLMAHALGRLSSVCEQALSQRKLSAMTLHFHLPNGYQSLRKHVKGATHVKLHGDIGANPAVQQHEAQSLTMNRLLRVGPETVSRAIVIPWAFAMLATRETFDYDSAAVATKLGSLWWADCPYVSNLPTVNLRRLENRFLPLSRIVRFVQKALD